MNDIKYETAIIDGDSIAWIIGYNNREQDLEGVVIAAVDSWVRDLLRDVGATRFVGYLANDTKTSIRRDIAPTYKSKRPETPDWYRKWAPIIEEHLVRVWNFQRASDGYEADDMIAAAANCFKEYDEFVICGVDKDLKQIPGNHYNYNKMELIHVTEGYGRRLLAIQTLMGDSTDSIKGIPKTGPKTAEKILEGVPEDVSPFVVCLDAYIKHFGEDLGVKEFYQNYMQVKLHTDFQFELVTFPTPANGQIPVSMVQEVKEVPVKPVEDTSYDMDNLFKVAS